MERTDTQIYELALEAALHAQMISIKARLSAARKYPLNPSMQFEAELLQTQLTALKEAYKRT